MRHPRVERGVRVLEDHLQRAAAGRGVGHRLAAEQDPAGVDGRQADRGAGQRGLAGAGLAHQADDLAGRHGQADAVDGGGRGRSGR